MNPDTPSLELCKRLAKVWPAEAGPMGLWFWKEKDSPSWTAPLPLPMANLDRLDIIPARTIGEMLAEAKREGLEVAIDATAPHKGIEVQVFYKRGVAIADEARTADALATALAEAKEKAKA